MKVVLINPPRENEIIGNNPKIIEKERGHNPPLGLLYVAGYTAEHSDHELTVIDAQVEELSYEQIGARLTEIQPDVVGLTAMTLTLLDVMRTVEAAKEARSETTVVLGGPHVHLFPEETIRLAGVDFLVLGEGEEAFVELLDALGDENRLRQIPGLVFLCGEEIVNTGMRPPIEDLDALPFPDRRSVPYDKYDSLLAAGEIATTVFTSRGCPFQCRFCDRPHLGKRFRARSSNNVVDELEDCLEIGIRDFLIYDDTFTVQRQRVLDICDEIVRRKLDISFDIRARVDTIDDEMLTHLRKAGCEGIHYGVEAGTEKILTVLNKGITLERAKESFDMTRKHGIPTLAYFMIGSPTETEEDIRSTFKVMRWLNPDYVHLTVLTPFPGTEIYFDALDKGVIEGDVWREFARDPQAAFAPPYWGDLFTREQLNDLLVEGYRSFYLRPRYILRRLWKLRSWSELKKKARAGLGVFKMKSR